MRDIYDIGDFELPVNTAVCTVLPDVQMSACRQVSFRTNAVNIGIK